MAPGSPTVAEVVGPHGLRPGCGKYEATSGLPGGPLRSDAWSGWLSKYYHGADLSAVRNIVWSNGLLDPWSGGGVYPPGGGIDGPAVQNISSDGSQIALLIDLGAHHLDLFFTNAADPPSVVEARKIEERKAARARVAAAVDGRVEMSAEELRAEEHRHDGFQIE